MNIDWKHLATTKGYKSLKAAYVYDVKKGWRNKKESFLLFIWAIGRAKHYAHHTGRSIESILNEWEDKRSYWWRNFYQDCNQPKFHSSAKKPMGVNGTRSYYKKSIFRGDSQAVKNNVSKFIQREQRENSVKKKARWPMSRKKRGY